MPGTAFCGSPIRRPWPWTGKPAVCRTTSLGRRTHRGPCKTRHLQAVLHIELELLGGYGTCHRCLSLPREANTPQCNERTACWLLSCNYCAKHSPVLAESLEVLAIQPQAAIVQPREFSTNSIDVERDMGAVLKSCRLPQPKTRGNQKQHHNHLVFTSLRLNPPSPSVGSFRAADLVTACGVGWARLEDMAFTAGGL